MSLRSRKIMGNDLIDRFFHARDAKVAWPKEVERRAQGHSVQITSDYFFHTNPIHEPNLSMQYVVGRYEAAYDALARLKPRSVLEIGCAQGLSTWLMTGYAERVVGLDISEARVAIGRTLFPEVEWVCDDFSTYLRNHPGERFDVVVNSHGPVYSAPEISAACRHYIYIGYRAKTWGKALTGGHKLGGHQLSFSTTLAGEGHSGLNTGYGRYFLRRNWLKEARHALSHGYALPI